MRLVGPGVELWFETEADTAQRFVHLVLLDRQPFGKAQWLRAKIPLGTWLTLPPHLTPLVRYFTKHVGFEVIPIPPQSGLETDGATVLRRVR